jgi:hypothetical protein
LQAARRPLVVVVNVVVDVVVGGERTPWKRLERAALTWSAAVESTRLPATASQLAGQITQLRPGCDQSAALIWRRPPFGLGSSA